MSQSSATNHEKENNGHKYQGLWQKIGTFIPDKVLIVIAVIYMVLGGAFVIVDIIHIAAATRIHLKTVLELCDTFGTFILTLITISLTTRANKISERELDIEAKNEKLLRQPFAVLVDVQFCDMNMTRIHAERQNQPIYGAQQLDGGEETVNDNDQFMTMLLTFANSSDYFISVEYATCTAERDNLPICAVGGQTIRKVQFLKAGESCTFGIYLQKELWYKYEQAETSFEVELDLQNRFAEQYTEKVPFRFSFTDNQRTVLPDKTRVTFESELPLIQPKADV